MFGIEENIGHRAEGMEHRERSQRSEVDGNSKLQITNNK
jgi:hypothetical protein